MSEREIFDSMDDKSKVFYRRLFADCMMNTWAYKRGYFPFLLCETDSPMIARLWRETVPNIANLIRESNQRALDAMKKIEPPEEPV